MDPCFSPSIYGPCASRFGHKSIGKNAGRYSQYCPRTRSVRGIYWSASQHKIVSRTVGMMGDLAFFQFSPTRCSQRDPTGRKVGAATKSVQKKVRFTSCHPHRFAHIGLLATFCWLRLIQSTFSWRTPLLKTDPWCWSLQFLSHFTVLELLYIRQTPL